MIVKNRRIEQNQQSLRSIKPKGVQQFILAISLAITALLNTSAQSGMSLSWTKVSGPWGSDADGTFGSVAVHPSNPNVMFVGCGILGPGIFKSTDGGTTWVAKNNGISQMGLFAKNYPPISKIAISPSDPNVIYCSAAQDYSLLAGGYGAIYRSGDGGESWQIANGRRSLFGYQIRTSILDFDVHPQNPDIVYAGVSGKGVLKTSNGGSDWSMVYSAGSSDGTVDYFNVVRISPLNPNTVLFSGFTYYFVDTIPGLLTVSH